MKNTVHLVGALFLVFSPILFADSFFVLKQLRELYEPEQKAVLFFDAGLEELIIQVKYRGDVDEFAWIVPTPTQPAVEVTDNALFKELKDYTSARAKLGRPTISRRARAAAGLPGGIASVTVLERTRKGAFDVAVLAATGSDGLQAWLAENGYQVPAKGKPILQEYIDKGWFFTAMRIHPDAKGDDLGGDARRGLLQPLRFTFKTEQPVYPMRISTINPGNFDLLLYVFALEVLLHPALETDAPPGNYHAFLPARQTTKFDSSWYDFESRYYRPPAANKLPHCQKALPRLRGNKFYLMKMRNHFKPEEITDDFLLKPIEKLSVAEQSQFVRQHSLHRFNTLMEFMPDGVIAYLSEHFKDAANNGGLGFFIAASHATPAGLKLLSKGANHPESDIRNRVADGLMSALQERPWPEQEAPAVLFNLASVCSTLLLQGGEAGRTATKALILIDHPIATELRAEMTLDSFLEENSDKSISEEVRLLALRSLSYMNNETWAAYYNRLKARGFVERLSEKELRACALAFASFNPEDRLQRLQEPQKVCRKSGLETTATWMGEVQRQALKEGSVPQKTKFLAKGMDFEEVSFLLEDEGKIYVKAGPEERKLIGYRWEKLEATFLNGLLTDWDWN